MKVNEILQQTKKVKSFLLFNEKLAYTLAFRVFPLPPKFFVRYFLKSFSVSFTI